MDDLMRSFQNRMLLRRLVYEQVQSGTMTDSDILGFSSLFPERISAGGLALSPNDYISDGVDENGYQKVYKTSQAITIQPNIQLSTIPFMTLIGYVDDTRIWVKPLGIRDKYVPGAIVHHNGKKWINVLDDGSGGGNGFAPGEFGWDEVVEA